VEHLGDPGAVLVVDLCRYRDYAEEPVGAAHGAVGDAGLCFVRGSRSSA
jgi:hypothetical protein